MSGIKERIRGAIVRAVRGSELSRGEFAERADINVPSLLAYISESVDFRTPSIETLIRIALASNDPDAFMLSLLPLDSKRADWTAEEKNEALNATDGMTREALQMISQAKSEAEAASRMNSCFAACYLMAYDARVRSLRGRCE